VDFLVSDPDTVVLGNARAESMYCFLTIVFFTVVAGVIFRFLAYDTGFRKELRGAIDREMKPLPKKTALFFIVPPWLLLCGWFYNATLGSKFFALKKEGEGADRVWTFVYEYPHRERRVPAAQVDTWGNYVIWKRRYVKHALVARVGEDHRIMSSGLDPDAYRKQAEILRSWGISIVTVDPKDGEPLPR